ncbi:hypothetical protein GPECTOR_75g738 [Gonium pectorale]|uniref:Uncharacterized protein n=1 Tax=Gonium pectorale TaxID=33097 RepID=A0A150G2H3_GONPE|nr:hypothetical protein GPECTOR_75g738 [Gonium pectorale]|eukprot:KXZ44014.1 hypothetical protein GPECTOR_75g738 [Gonium pectorale]
MQTHAKRKHTGAGVSAATLEERAAEVEAAQQRKREAAAAAAAAEAARRVPFDEFSMASRLKAYAALYARALQGLLQAQADAMVERFGAPPEIRTLLRSMWFGLLPLTGLLDFDMAARSAI